MSSAPRSASSLQKSQSSRTPPEHYADSVFLNCPFDSDYIPIFDAVVFAIFSCGFIARSALEITDSSEVRIDKICRIISNSKLAVHDLCRTELDADSNLPRFNMPLELGIFLGAKKLGTKIQREKSCLMLDREAFRYQKFISDIAGQDIRAHSGQPELRSAIGSLAQPVARPFPVAQQHGKGISDFRHSCRRYVKTPNCSQLR